MRNMLLLALAASALVGCSGDVTGPRQEDVPEPLVADTVSRPSDQAIISLAPDTLSMSEMVGVRFANTVTVQTVNISSLSPDDFAVISDLFVVNTLAVSKSGAVFVLKIDATAVSRGTGDVTIYPKASPKVRTSFKLTVK